MHAIYAMACVAIGVGIAIWGLWRFVSENTALESELRGLKATELAWQRAIVQADERIAMLEERVAAIRETSASLEIKIDDGEKILSPVERERLPTVYILSDRLTNGRTSYCARIKSSLGLWSGKGERDYVLWARDREQAMQIFAARFRARDGFIIGPVTVWNDSANERPHAGSTTVMTF